MPMERNLLDLEGPSGTITGIVVSVEIVIEPFQGPACP